jgi:hypothetical protein
MMSFSAAMDSIRLLGFRSCRMSFPPESPQSARSRPPGSFLISDSQRPAFQLYQNAPFFPQPLFPRLGSGHRLVPDQGTGF